MTDKCTCGGVEGEGIYWCDHCIEQMDRQARNTPYAFHYPQPEPADDVPVGGCVFVIALFVLALLFIAMHGHG